MRRERGGQKIVRLCGALRGVFECVCLSFVASFVSFIFLLFIWFVFLFLFILMRPPLGFVCPGGWT